MIDPKASLAAHCTSPPLSPMPHTHLNPPIPPDIVPRKVVLGSQPICAGGKLVVPEKESYVA